MVDYVKLLIKDVLQTDWINNPLLDFGDRRINENAEETTEQYKRIASYHKLEFVIYPSGIMVVKGSLHKYWNSKHGVYAPSSLNDKSKDKGFNGNDFNIVALFEVVSDLKTLFNINPCNAIIQNVEFGVNIIAPIAIKKILDSLFLHKSKEFDRLFGGYLKKVTHGRYSIKIYDKSKQYCMGKSIIRIETKHNKAIDFKPTGIVALKDLLNPVKIEKAGQRLVENWRNMFFNDFTIRENELTKLQKNKLKEYSNIAYWRELLETTTRQNFKKHKDSFDKIVQSHSCNLSREISKLIMNKWIELTEVVDILTAFSEQKKVDVLTEKSNSEKLQNSLRFNHSDKGVKSQPLRNKKSGYMHSKDKVKKCKVTGLDISMQRKDSFLLSHTGLKWLIKTAPDTYKRVKREHLTNKWLLSGNEVQIREMAHHIRDRWRFEKQAN